MNDILAVKNLSYTVKVKHGILYKNQDLNILKDISFSLKEGEILGVVGETGSGKSTLAKVLAGIIKKTGGEIKFNQNIIKSDSLVNPVQILFQNNGDILNPLRVVESLVKEVILISRGEELDENDDILNIFNTLDIPLEIMHNKSYQISGGQRQRVALARLLSINPKLLILDEPFSAQDIESQLNLVSLLKRINEENSLSMICISHNLRLLKDFAHRLIVLYDGKIVEEGSTEQILNNPQHPYTKFLFKADKYELALSDFNSVFA